MKLRNLLEEADEGINTKQQEVSLATKMKEFYGVIARYERDGKIHKDDKQKIETLKDFITDMVKQEARRNED